MKRFGKHHLDITDISLCESALTITQIIFPHPNEDFGIAHFPDLINIGKKASAILKHVGSRSESPMPNGAFVNAAMHGSFRPVDVNCRLNNEVLSV